MATFNTFSIKYEKNVLQEFGIDDLVINKSIVKVFILRISSPLLSKTFQPVPQQSPEFAEIQGNRSNWIYSRTSRKQVPRTSSPGGRLKGGGRLRELKPYWVKLMPHLQMITAETYPMFDSYEKLTWRNKSVIFY